MRLKKRIDDLLEKPQTYLVLATLWATMAVLNAYIFTSDGDILSGVLTFVAVVFAALDYRKYDRMSG